MGCLLPCEPCNDHRRLGRGPIDPPSAVASESVRRPTDDIPRPTSRFTESRLGRGRDRAPTRPSPAQSAADHTPAPDGRGVAIPSFEVSPGRTSSEDTPPRFLVPQLVSPHPIVPPSPDLPDRRRARLDALRRRRTDERATAAVDLRLNRGRPGVASAPSWARSVRCLLFGRTGRRRRWRTGPRPNLPGWADTAASGLLRVVGEPGRYGVAYLPGFAARRRRVRGGESPTTHPVLCPPFKPLARLLNFVVGRPRISNEAFREWGTGAGETEVAEPRSSATPVQPAEQSGTRRPVAEIDAIRAWLDPGGGQRLSGVGGRGFGGHYSTHSTA